MIVKRLATAGKYGGKIWIFITIREVDKLCEKMI